jgi:hypothetical protein
MIRASDLEPFDPASAGWMTFHDRTTDEDVGDARVFLTRRSEQGGLSVPAGEQVAIGRGVRPAGRRRLRAPGPDGPECRVVTLNTTSVDRVAIAIASCAGSADIRAVSWSVRNPTDRATRGETSRYLLYAGCRMGPVSARANESGV